MSQVEISLSRNRSSYFNIVINRKYLYILPCSFSFKRFAGTEPSHCKWYVNAKFDWLCFRFEWMIKRSK